MDVPGKLQMLLEYYKRQHAKLAESMQSLNSIDLKIFLKTASNQSVMDVAYGDPKKFTVTVMGQCIPNMKKLRPKALSNFQQQVEHCLQNSPEELNSFQCIQEFSDGRIVLTFDYANERVQDSIVEKLRELKVETPENYSFSLMPHISPPCHILHRLLKMKIMRNACVMSGNADRAPVEDSKIFTNLLISCHIQYHGLSRDHRIFLTNCIAETQLGKFVVTVCFYDKKMLPPIPDLQTLWQFPFGNLKESPISRWYHERITKGEQLTQIQPVLYPKSEEPSKVVLSFGFNFMTESLDLGVDVGVGMDACILPAASLPNIPNEFIPVIEAVKRATLLKNPSVSGVWNKAVVQRNHLKEYAVVLSLKYREALRALKLRETISLSSFKETPEMSAIKTDISRELTRDDLGVRKIILDYLSPADGDKNSFQSDGVETIFLHPKQGTDVEEMVCGVSVAMGISDEYSGAPGLEEFCSAVDKLLNVRENTVLISVCAKSIFPVMVAAKKCRRVLYFTFKEEADFAADCFHRSGLRNVTVRSVRRSCPELDLAALKDLAKSNPGDVVVLLDGRARVLVAKEDGCCHGMKLAMFLRTWPKVRHILLATDTKTFRTRGGESCLCKFFPHVDFFFPDTLCPVVMHPGMDRADLLVRLKRIPFVSLFPKMQPQGERGKKTEHFRMWSFWLDLHQRNDKEVWQHAAMLLSMKNYDTTYVLDKEGGRWLLKCMPECGEELKMMRSYRRNLELSDHGRESVESNVNNVMDQFKEYIRDHPEKLTESGSMKGIKKEDFEFPNSWIRGKVMSATLSWRKSMYYRMRSKLRNNWEAKNLPVLEELPRKETSNVKELSGVKESPRKESSGRKDSFRSSRWSTSSREMEESTKSSREASPSMNLASPAHSEGGGSLPPWLLADEENAMERHFEEEMNEPGVEKNYFSDEKPPWELQSSPDIPPWMQDQPSPLHEYWKETEVKEEPISDLKYDLEVEVESPKEDPCSLKEDIWSTDEEPPVNQRNSMQTRSELPPWCRLNVATSIQTSEPCKEPLKIPSNKSLLSPRPLLKGISFQDEFPAITPSKFLPRSVPTPAGKDLVRKIKPEQFSALISSLREKVDAMRKNSIQPVANKTAGCDNANRTVDKGGDPPWCRKDAIESRFKAPPSDYWQEVKSDPLPPLKEILMKTSPPQENRMRTPPPPPINVLEEGRKKNMELRKEAAKIKAEVERKKESEERKGSEERWRKKSRGSSRERSRKRSRESSRRERSMKRSRESSRRERSRKRSRDSSRTEISRESSREKSRESLREKYREISRKRSRGSWEKSGGSLREKSGGSSREKSGGSSREKSRGTSRERSTNRSRERSEERLEEMKTKSEGGQCLPPWLQKSAIDAFQMEENPYELFELKQVEVEKSKPWISVLKNVTVAPPVAGNPPKAVEKYRNLLPYGETFSKN